jgi:hypothetical protein
MNLLSRPPRILLCAAVVAALTVSTGPVQAQMRQQLQNRIVDDVANQMVTTIQNDSCPEFQHMMKKQKGGGNSGKASAMMKKNPAMRERFVNKVAGPLVNKLIDCDMLPKS